jgi:hypothetical protein
VNIAEKMQIDVGALKVPGYRPPLDISLNVIRGLLAYLRFQQFQQERRTQHSKSYAMYTRVTLSNECSICWGHEGDWVRLNCTKGHVIHKVCIDLWIDQNHKTCPMCLNENLRADMIDVCDPDLRDVPAIREAAFPQTLRVAHRAAADLRNDVKRKIIAALQVPAAHRDEVARQLREARRAVHGANRAGDTDGEDVLIDVVLQVASAQRDEMNRLLEETQKTARQADEAADAFNEAVMDAVRRSRDENAAILLLIGALGPLVLLQSLELLADPDVELSPRHLIIPFLVILCCYRQYTIHQSS